LAENLTKRWQAQFFGPLTGNGSQKQADLLDFSRFIIDVALSLF
jgi:hypothetical protein